MRKLIEYEFQIHCAPALLFQYISNPASIEKWFCDKVIKVNDSYTFHWDGESELKTKLTLIRNNKLLHFEILNQAKPSEYFELEIVEDQITSDVEIIAREFCEEAEIEQIKKIWHAAFTQLAAQVGG